MRAWVQILLRLTPAQHAKATQIAEERGDSMSGAIRHALLEYELATPTLRRGRPRRHD